MLQKYYYNGKTPRYNDTFITPTGDEIVWPRTVEKIRDMITSYRDELDIYGFVRCLYLEKPDNSNRYWKVVVAVWSNADDYGMGFEPNKVLRINTDNLYQPVCDKYTGEYTQNLPISAFYKFLNESGKDFF